MYDFFKIIVGTKPNKSKIMIYPEFNTSTKSKDLMIRGGDFYAIWLEDEQIWSTDIQEVAKLIDKCIYEKAEEIKDNCDGVPELILLSNFSSKKWTEFRNYCKSLPDNFHDLNKSIIFSNTNVKKTDYVSKRLDYPLEKTSIDAYEEIISTLYSKEERRKIEWSIGAVISGDSKNIQKFMVFYGDPGTGKSTVLQIIQMLFPQYYVAFSSKKLGSNSNFTLQTFRSNPLIGIDPDAKLSKIETNTTLNSLIAHDYMEMEEKFKSPYSTRFDTFLFIASNEPVKITDAKSGLIRRLIDIHPTGKLIDFNRYNELIDKIKFELSGIAYHCLEVYTSMGPSYYNNYISTQMISETNDFYNFIEDNYEFFAVENPEGVQLGVAWIRYKEYCEEARVPYPFSKRIFKNELKNYFDEFKERDHNVRNMYYGFKKDKFQYKPIVTPDDVPKKESWLKFNKSKSLFDDIFKDCPAQLTSEKETPLTKWSECTTVLNDISTDKLHYVKVPRNLIVIDFDIKDENGNKSYELNYKAASRWPATYAELSKSGAGIHLHYIYDGDVDKLSRLYDTDIEIKVFKGNSSLRRCLSKCNDISIATISSGLPLKEEKVVTDSIIKDEKHLRAKIIKALKKEVHPATKPNMDYINMVLDEAYKSGMKYDVTDMAPDIQTFALHSTHQSDYCLNLINKMHFASDDEIPSNNGKEGMPIIFYDVEIFPNLFVLCWKKQGKENGVVKMINPSPDDINSLIKYRLVGYNNRRYDNHILYARLMGYNNMQLFNLSQRIIDGDRNAFFGEAYSLSYTDIYDFLSASNKMSLKKWEIKLGIHHQENNYPWDKPLDESHWEEVAGYCCNDVIATEAVWNANQEDWMAREILADLSGLSVNDTTNSHTTRIIVGTAKKPQEEFVYTDLSTIFPGYEFSSFGIDKSRYNDGEKIVSGKSIYKGKDPGEGGRVYSEPGMYTNVALLDIASMHPHSLIRLNMFGDKYTKRFKELVDIRLMIKHKEYDKAKNLLDGKLAKYLEDPNQAKKLANALKTAINSVYGLTSARFENKLKDPRNIDNIVAKYGALFMINLQEEVQKRGFTVAHIKTDSIKIPNATPEIIQFVMDYGKEYGYTFEHEATYAKMCLVNESVYVAQYDNGEWTATGAQFQVPYVFKTLFTHEKIDFIDICETKSTTTSLYLDYNENLGEDEHDYVFVGRVGSFVPVKPGNGGGVLLYLKGEQHVHVAGTNKKGKIPKDEELWYRWLESEAVNKETYNDILDDKYYHRLVDDAIETISKYGDFEWFRS